MLKISRSIATAALLVLTCAGGLAATAIAETPAATSQPATSQPATSRPATTQPTTTQPTTQPTKSQFRIDFDDCMSRQTIPPWPGEPPAGEYGKAQWLQRAQAHVDAYQRAMAECYREAKLKQLLRDVKKIIGEGRQQEQDQGK